eukprot:g39278.t1
MCLNKFQGLDLSPKEYAYLKGAILFNPGNYDSLCLYSKSSIDLLGLRAAGYIESLQREAQRALYEIVVSAKGSSRFACILLAVSALKTVSTGLIIELFFRP